MRNPLRMIGRAIVAYLDNTTASIYTRGEHSPEVEDLIAVDDPGRAKRLEDNGRHRRNTIWRRRWRKWFI